MPLISCYRYLLIAYHVSVLVDTKGEGGLALGETLVVLGNLDNVLLEDLAPVEVLGFSGVGLAVLQL